MLNDRSTNGYFIVIAALNQFVELGASFKLYNLLPEIALLLTLRMNCEDAARLLGFAEKLRTDSHGLRDPIDYVLFKRAMNDAAAAFSPEGFEALLAEGATLSQSAAVNLARVCLLPRRKRK